MELRQLTPRHFVASQITAEDVPAIAEAGISVLICNRPDSEITADRHAARIAEAAETAGLHFVDNPMSFPAVTPEILDTQRRALETEGAKVLAYCNSGTRSTVMWALCQAGSMPVPEIVAAAAAAGYDLSSMQPQLEAMAAGR